MPDAHTDAVIFQFVDGGAPMIFRDRSHAGQLLAQKLQKYKNGNSLVLALPRGGVPIASEIAKALQVPLDVLIVRKIGAPLQPELAVGAICEENEPIWNEAILFQMGLAPDDLGRTVGIEREKMKNQIKKFRQSRKFPSIDKKTVIIVDDGLATGATMSAAVKFLRRKGAARTIVAVPVAAETSAAKLRSKVDDVVTLEESGSLMSVGQWYEDFSQVSDEEVMTLLKNAGPVEAGIPFA